MRTGIMKVMNDMAEPLQGDDEPEPSLDDMVAAFEAAQPVELVRSRRKLIVEYRYEDGHWRATSPDLMGFEVSGRSLHEIRQRVKADLAGYLDPEVELDERAPDPAATRGASRSRVTAAPVVITNSSTTSRSRIVVSPSRLVSA
jgi:predicted RNase H-like HicB family nuclease